ncbi:MAG: VWA domain-containing protein [Janthinobacterium lividum]
MTFTLESYYNPYLSPGADRVDAILTVTSSGSTVSGGEAVIGLILDTSGSMGGDRIEAVKEAASRAVSLLGDDDWFFIAGFSSHVMTIAPLAQATAQNKAAAIQQVRRIAASGGTCMSLGLQLAREIFNQKPDAGHQALFLTDGKNNEEDDAALETTLQSCMGVFQCDCRGVGTDWQVKQLKQISRALLGSSQIIAEPGGMEADFHAAITQAINRGVRDVRLRLWTPKSAHVVSVKQMSPEIAVLTDRRLPVDAQSADYPTGAWGQESRDFHVTFELATPGAAGDEMLAGRPSLIYEESGQIQELKAPDARILASWTADDSLSARINAQVAHYTGQEELAQVIQQGLEARAQGDTEGATKLLGRAAQIAKQSGHDETMVRLSKVVDIVDADHGTVRLKKAVNKADEMDLDLGSTRTAPVRRKL